MELFKTWNITILICLTQVHIYIVKTKITKSFAQQPAHWLYNTYVFLLMHKNLIIFVLFVIVQQWST